MNKKIVNLTALLCCSAGLLAGCGKDKNRNKDEYDESGRLILNMRNMYFSTWDNVEDPYTKIIQDKFGVTFDHSAYSDIDWSSQVSGEVNSQTMPDVFHYDIESFNFGNTYKTWADYYECLKALPDDLSPWPNVQKIFKRASNIDALKVNGKYYGIPLIYDLENPNKTFSSFTYYYRRDWAKDLGVYKENDEYTWEEFIAVLEAFNGKTGVDSALGDADWAFPSITNFYKNSPHCYTYNSSGKVVCNFTSDEYITGLQKAKEFTGKYYADQAANQNKTLTFEGFRTSKIGVYYDNISLSNFIKMRTAIKNARPGITQEALDDASAIMKVKGPDGKFALEGSENWYSMTLFNKNISDLKLTKVLDVINYVLSEEGKMLAVYGIEGEAEDYWIEDGKVVLNPDNWIKDPNTGEYPARSNGAKSLRYLATLSNDTNSIDPYIDQHANEIITTWQNEMVAAKANGTLRLFEEPKEIKWLSTEAKDEYTDGLLNAANGTVLNYCYNSSGITTIEKYKNEFKDPNWSQALSEINTALGK